MILSWWRRFRLRRALHRSPLDDHTWRRLRDTLPLLQPLKVKEAVKLRELTTLFLEEKVFNGAGGLEVDLWKRSVIASQACLMVLELGLESYRGWTEIILYPEIFRVQREVTDEAGIVHPQAAVLSGESWERGPLVLAWNEVERDSLHLHPGRHVVIHEFAHKLDALNGRANGMPPLHPDMPIEEWTRSLSEAYARLQKQVEGGSRHACINPYGATSPAEFFAVVSEYFFTAPRHLEEKCPRVFRELLAYYRQDPRKRMEHRSPG